MGRRVELEIVFNFTASASVAFASFFPFSFTITRVRREHWGLFCMCGMLAHFTPSLTFSHAYLHVGLCVCMLSYIIPNLELGKCIQSTHA